MSLPTTMYHVIVYCKRPIGLFRPCGTRNGKVEKTFKLTRMSNKIITTVPQDERIFLANIMISSGVWVEHHT